ncbi:MAG: DUF3892 domain-containing protein [Candidatus Moranbacteria bacterium]|nr:DUF3892 domain-containing protein [Candidatus Moranbacteria bacterium]
MAVRIICINKDNGDHYDPHEAITNLGWINESSGKSDKSTRMQVVEYLEGGGRAYVKDMFGNLVYLIVKISRAGNKYVKTIADGKETNNLLELPECR